MWCIFFIFLMFFIIMILINHHQPPSSTTIITIITTTTIIIIIIIMMYVSCILHHSSWRLTIFDCTNPKTLKAEPKMTWRDDSVWPSSLANRERGRKPPHRRPRRWIPRAYREGNGAKSGWRTERCWSKKLSLRKMSRNVFLVKFIVGAIDGTCQWIGQIQDAMDAKQFRKPILPSCTPFENLAVILDGMATEWKGFFQYSVAATCSEQQHVRNSYGPWRTFKRETLLDLPHSSLNACVLLYGGEKIGIRCVSGI